MSLTTGTPQQPNSSKPDSPYSLERWSSVDQTDESSLYPLSEESTAGDETEDETGQIRNSELTFGQGRDGIPIPQGQFDDSPHDVYSTATTAPKELDVSSLIAAIEHTPTAWGANFWVVLSDPVTACTFYACPATGDCSWDPPVGAMVLPRRLGGEYWELKDERREGRSYYYHTGTGKTQWTRPKDELVIPLGMIQMNALRGSSKAIAGETERREGSTRSGSTVVIKDSASERTVDRPSPGPKHRTQLTPSKPILKVTATGTDTSGRKKHDRPVPPTPLSSKDPFVSYERRTGTDPSLVTPFGGQNISLRQVPPSGSHDVSETVDIRQGRGAESPTSPLRVKFYHHTNNSSTPNLGVSPSPYSSPKIRTTSRFNNIALSSWGSSSKSTAAVIEMRSDTSFMFTATGESKVIPTTQTDGSETEKENEKGSRGRPGKGRRRRESSVKTLWMARERQSTAPVMTLSDVIRQQGGGDMGVNVDERLDPPVRLGLRKTTSDRDIRQSSIVLSPPTRIRPAMPAITGSAGLRDGPILVDQRSPGDGSGPGSYPKLSPDTVNQPQAFGIESYTRDYFATQRKGVLRRKIPDAQIMEWQESVITGALLSKTKTPPTEIIRAFKVIQHIMGDRDRPVEGIVTVSSSTSAFSLADMAQSSPSQKDRIWNKAEKRLMLEEERWLLQLGLGSLDLRDELYAMCMKQVTKNPIFSSTLRGFQLICVLVVTFGPSNEFEPYVRSFLQTSQIEGDPALRTIALHCKRKLDNIVRRGPRSRAPMYSEIEQAFSAAFHPSIFGERLDHIMAQQRETGSSLPIPRILSFLAESIIALGGTRSEGIFRTTGDLDSIGEMRSRLDRGEYHLTGVEDPHIITALLKLWLRELEEPVIPEDLYNEALQSSRDPKASCALIQRLPPTERCVLIYIIGFLQLFIQPRWIAFTKMTAGALALVMAPNILRPISMSSDVVFANTAFETSLVVNLLEHLDVQKADPDYTPEFPNPAPRLVSTMTLLSDF